MPGLNGIQLYQILKALDPKLKVLFISALDSAQEIISVLPSIIESHSLIVLYSARNRKFCFRCMASLAILASCIDSITDFESEVAPILRKI
jgi:hypothetical protein